MSEVEEYEFEEPCVMRLEDRLERLEEEIESAQKRFQELNSSFVELIGRRRPRGDLTYQAIRWYVQLLDWDNWDDLQADLEEWDSHLRFLQKAVAEWNSINEDIYLTLRGRCIDCTAVLASNGSIKLLMETVM